MRQRQNLPDHGTGSEVLVDLLWNVRSHPNNLVSIHRKRSHNPILFACNIK
jgi:hypothetical protein